MKWDDVTSPTLRPGVKLSLLHHNVLWVSRTSTMFWRGLKNTGPLERGISMQEALDGLSQASGPGLLSCCWTDHSALCMLCRGLCTVLVWTMRGGLRWWLDPLTPPTAPSTCHRESVAAISVLPGCPQSGPGPLTFSSVTPHLFLFYPKPCVKGYFKKLFRCNQS